MKYRVLHHQSRSHYGLQLADYCCWAVFRMWRTGDLAWYNLIRPAVKNELEVHAPSPGTGGEKDKVTPPTTPLPERAPMALLSSGGDL